MVKIGLMLTFAVLFLFAVNVQALNICDFEHVPPYPSVNSSMLLIIPRATVQTELVNLSHPMKVSYWFTDSDFNTIDEGAFQKFKDCWLCEYSGKISNFYGNCGPTPFKRSGQFKLSFTARDFDQLVDFERNILIHSGVMSSGMSVDSSGKVSITVDAPIDTKEVWLTLYNADNGELIQDFNHTELLETEYPGRYTMEITSLSVGTYYAEFGFKTIPGRSGGSVSKFEIKTQEVELSVDTDRDSYWLGEEVRITGQSQYSQVTASVRLPNGRTEFLGSANVVNQQFSYNFKLLNTYDEGNFEVTVNAGSTSARATFSAEKILDVYPDTLNYMVTNRSQIIEKTVTVDNTGNSTVTLSVSTEGITSYVTTSFDKRTLTPGTSSTLTVRLNPATLASSTTGRVLVTGNNIVTIPIDVTVTLSVPSNGGPPIQGAKIEISPGFWGSNNCKIGEKLELSFTVRNAGEGDLSGFGYSTSSSDIEDIIDDITLPQSTVSAGSTSSMDLDITPDKERISGSVEITTETGGSATIYLSLNCIRDISGDISTLETETESLRSQFTDAGFDDDAVTSMFYYLDRDLESSSSSLGNRDYVDAKESYAAAQARYDTLYDALQYLKRAAPSGDGSWITWVIVIIVIAVIGVIGFFLYTKYGSKVLGGGGEEEEGLEEELY